MIVGTVFSITPAFVYWFGGLPRRSPARPDARRRSATSSPSPRCRAASSSRSASCSTSRSRSRARWRCSTASSSTSTCPPRSRTRPTRSRSTARPVARRDPLPPRRRSGTDRRRERRRVTGARAVVEADGREPATTARELPSATRMPFGLEDVDFEVEPGQLVALVGPVRVGQDDDDLPGAAPVRRRRGRGGDRRPRRARRDASQSSGDVDRLRDAGDVPVPRHRAREPALRQARTPPTTSSRPPRGWRPSTTGSASCPRATTRSSASAATSCPAARSSASRSPGSC